MRHPGADPGTHLFTFGVTMKKITSALPSHLLRLPCIPFRGHMGDDSAKPDDWRQGQGPTLAAARSMDAARCLPPRGSGPKVPPEPRCESPLEVEAEDRAQLGRRRRRCQLRVGGRLCTSTSSSRRVRFGQSAVATSDFRTRPLGAQSSDAVADE